MRRSFWMRALESLHPSVRVRYAPYFHRAEACERELDAALALWRGARRRAAWLLLRAARRLRPGMR